MPLEDFTATAMIYFRTIVKNAYIEAAKLLGKVFGEIIENFLTWLDNEFKLQKPISFLEYRDYDEIQYKKRRPKMMPKETRQEKSILEGYSQYIAYRINDRQLVSISRENILLQALDLQDSNIKEQDNNME